MQRAYKSVEEGELSIRRAAEAFDIPKSTLYDKISGRSAFGKKSGPPRYLSDSEEGELVNFLVGCSKVGYPRSRKEVMALAQRIVKEKGIEVSVSSGWWESFRKRHPEISLRAPEPLANVRAASSHSEVLDKYYEILEDALRTNDLIEKPCQIFNCDETGMPLTPHPPRIVAQKGVKHSTAITSGDKTQITVLACCSAGGYVIPPFVIFDRKTLKPEMTSGEVPGTMYGLSSKGWIDSELFDLWFTHHFLAYAPPTRPLLLLLDGHSSHYNPSFVSKAAEEKVLVFCLPPHTTHVTQPLDTSCFGSLKRVWVEECHRYLSENPGRVITRFEFSALFHRAWVRAMTMVNIVAGFRSSGVYPLNRSAQEAPAKSTREPQNFNPSSLGERTGLKYIPLYSPARPRQHTTQSLEFSEDEFHQFQRLYEKGLRQSTNPRYIYWARMYHPDSTVSLFSPCGDSSEDDREQTSLEEQVHCHARNLQRSSVSDDEQELYVPHFTQSELSLFERKYEDECDLHSNPRYKQWVQAYHPRSRSTQGRNPGSSSLQPSKAASKTVSSKTPPHYSSAILARVLKHPTPTIKIPASRPKSSGRVLTSEENLRILEEKERKKQEEAEMKKKKKEEREERARQKREEAEKRKRQKEKRQQKHVSSKGM